MKHKGNWFIAIDDITAHNFGKITSVREYFEKIIS